MLKKTPLNSVHKKLNAKMVEFGCWEMPVYYTNVMDEHLTTRTKAGLFDICHMGEFIVEGEKALEFLQKLMTNDVSKLELGKAEYSCMCYENGTVIDDLFIYGLEENKYVLVVNAGNIDRDFDWLQKNKIEGVELKNISNETAKLDLQGPLADKVAQKLTDFNLAELPRFYSKNIKFDNVDVLISRTGYTAEKGFELYFNPKYAEKLWNDILEAGKDEGIKPIGLGARDTLRIEACYSLYGHEINEETTPIEAGLKFVVNIRKDFIGKEVLKTQIEGGAPRQLICFELAEKGIPREHYPILKDGEKIGEVTSGTFSPTFKKGLGMALVRLNSASIGDEIEVYIRERAYKAKVVKRPFYSFKG